MIPLPPGCKVNYEIKFYVFDISDEMGQWFQLQGGKAWATNEYDHRGREKIVKHVKFGDAKPSYKMQDGTYRYLVRFSGTDASLASLFLIKFLDDIADHNMKREFELVK